MSLRGSLCYVVTSQGLNVTSHTTHVAYVNLIHTQSESTQTTIELNLQGLLRGCYGLQRRQSIYV